MVKSGHAFCFGAYARGNFTGIPEATGKHQMLVKYLNAYLRARGASEGWSSIQTSKDLEAPPHKDCHNVKNSMNQLTTRSTRTAT